MGKFCEQCGSQLKPGAAFCEACGARVKSFSANGNMGSRGTSNGSGGTSNVSGGTTKVSAGILAGLELSLLQMLPVRENQAV